MRAAGEAADVTDIAEQSGCAGRADTAGSRAESEPTGHLDPAWPDCGRSSMKQVAEMSAPMHAERCRPSSLISALSLSSLSRRDPRKPPNLSRQASSF